MKIAVIGYSGSGKSTLAAYLGGKIPAPVLHLDRVHWRPGWTENICEAELQEVGSFMDANASWVIDGNYSNLMFSRRMEEADRVLFLDFPRAACFYRALKRYFMYRGRTRDSIAEGCNEKMDWEFIWWILHKGRTEKQKKNYRMACRVYKDKVVVLKNQRQLSVYMGQVERTGVI